jgi:hypothetical protein
MLDKVSEQVHYHGYIETDKIRIMLKILAQAALLPQSLIFSIEKLLFDWIQIRFLALLSVGQVP